MPEITTRGKLFFREKNIAGRSLTNARFSAPRGMTLLRCFNRPANNPAHIRGEDRTSGRGRCKPGVDDEAWALLRPAPRLQSAQTADAESNVHLM